MTAYKFTLKFSLAEDVADPSDAIERLEQAGCDDALIGVGQAGRIALNFDREANSAFDAIASAVADVKRAIPDATLIAATPDLVGLTDIADLIGCSRQYMRKLMLNNVASFPPPVHDGKSALWRLCKVLNWLKERKHYLIEEPLLDVATIAMQFNLAKECREMDMGVQKNIRGLVG